MARKLPDYYHITKKKKSFERLVERYYGKLALLQAWEGREDVDLDYIRELKAKVRAYRNDLIYRGHDDAGNLSV